MRSLPAGVAATERARVHRVEPVSLFALSDGIWRCKCGHKSKIAVKVCPGKPKGGGCGLPRPRVKIGTSIPADIAVAFSALCDEKGIGLTAGLSLALREWK